MNIAAANREAIKQRFAQPGMTDAEVDQAIEQDYTAARDYLLTAKDIANLRELHNQLTWKLHQDDAESLRRWVCAADIHI